MNCTRLGLSYLDVVGQSSRVHATGHVDCVAPDVVLRFSGADDAGHHRSQVHADADREVVVRILIDAQQFVFHGQDEFNQLVSIP